MSIPLIIILSIVTGFVTLVFFCIAAFVLKKFFDWLNDKRSTVLIYILIFVVCMLIGYTIVMYSTEKTTTKDTLYTIKQQNNTYYTDEIQITFIENGKLKTIQGKDIEIKKSTP